MTGAASNRQMAHRLVDALAGRVSPSEVLTTGARVWAPHLGWSTDEGATTQIDRLVADLSIGELAVDAVVAADDLVVVEAVSRRGSAPPAPVTLTAHLDPQGRTVELRVYLDPECFGTT